MSEFGQGGIDAIGRQGFNRKATYRRDDVERTAHRFHACILVRASVTTTYAYMPSPFPLLPIRCRRKITRHQRVVVCSRPASALAEDHRNACPPGIQRTIDWKSSAHQITAGGRSPDPGVHHPYIHDKIQPPASIEDTADTQRAPRDRRKTSPWPAICAEDNQPPHHQNGKGRRQALMSNIGSSSTTITDHHRRHAHATLTTATTDRLLQGVRSASPDHARRAPSRSRHATLPLRSLPCVLICIHIQR